MQAYCLPASDEAPLVQRGSASTTPWMCSAKRRRARRRRCELAAVLNSAETAAVAAAGQTVERSGAALADWSKRFISRTNANSEHLVGFQHATHDTAQRVYDISSSSPDTCLQKITIPDICLVPNPNRHSFLNNLTPNPKLRLNFDPIMTLITLTVTVNTNPITQNPNLTNGHMSAMVAF